MKTYDELFTLLNKIYQGNLEWSGGVMKLWYDKTAGMLQ